MLEKFSQAPLPPVEPFAQAVGGNATVDINVHFKLGIAFVVDPGTAEALGQVPLVDPRDVDGSVEVEPNRKAEAAALLGRLIVAFVEIDCVADAVSVRPGTL